MREEALHGVSLLLRGCFVEYLHREGLCEGEAGGFCRCNVLFHFLVGVVPVTSYSLSQVCRLTDVDSVGCAVGELVDGVGVRSRGRREWRQFEGLPPA